ncbi:MAG: putative metal-binding motif-containing protein [Deltaproteobacteria bacterium]|nr:putative metal-binding motif-containing protein [Deltaproteobacteria bacterium]
MNCLKSLLIFPLLLVALTLGGCGSSTTSEPDDQGFLNDAEAGEEGVDAADVIQDEAVAEEIEPELEIDDADAMDGEEGEGQCVGTFLCPCEKNEQCFSYFCVESLEGNVCTKKCFEDGDCPEGWACKMVLNTDIDPVYICVPANIYLCRPCEINNECAPIYVSSSDLCVSYGGAGKFCGIDCKKKDCPAGYKCEDVTAVGGIEAKQCVPVDDGECSCTKKFIDGGFSTTCYNSGNFGTCFGKRMCTAGGLTECDAKWPEKEVCNDIDDNCDGSTDPEGTDGCVVYYLDNDGDGYGMGVGNCWCDNPGEGYSTVPGDCNDLSNSIYPGALEICNGLDDNCNTVVDEEGADGCSLFYYDGDNDFYGILSDYKCLCKGKAPYQASYLTPDCDDTNGAVFPGAQEKCNGIDDDCNNVIDEENALLCKPYYYDNDNDGYGVSSKFKCLCSPVGLYSTEGTGDCNDNDNAIYPLSEEKCNVVDDNCNGYTDEGDDIALCGVVDHGAAKCDGKCKIVSCEGTWNNLDDDYKNGCECQDDGNEIGGNSCSGAINLGNFPDTGYKQLVGGNISSTTDADWFVFTGNDNSWNTEPNNCDLYHVRAFFTKNPGDEFSFDIYRGSCAAGDNICSLNTSFNWGVNFHKDLDPTRPAPKGSASACRERLPTNAHSEARTTARKLHGRVSMNVRTTPRYITSRFTGAIPT